MRARPPARRLPSLWPTRPQMREEPAAGFGRIVRWGWPAGGKVRRGGALLPVRNLPDFTPLQKPIHHPLIPDGTRLVASAHAISRHTTLIPLCITLIPFLLRLPYSHHAASPAPTLIPLAPHLSDSIRGLPVFDLTTISTGAQATDAHLGVATWTTAHKGPTHHSNGDTGRCIGRTSDHWQPPLDTCDEAIPR